MDSVICSGCKSCATVCSKNAIKFQEDTEGFQIPIVDENNCVDCGLCIKVCPALQKLQLHDNEYKPKTFAFQYHNELVRKQSASGALFPAFANYFIYYLKGYVCGCVLDEHLIAKHIVSNKWEDVERMQDSKYVQSDICDCLSEVILLLKKGEYVLFTGTSCQVKGLLNAIKIKKVDFTKLLTIDFFCHGVPSPMVWRDYVNYYKFISGHNVCGYKFRNKKYGWGKGPHVRGTGFLSTWNYDSKYIEDYSLLSRIWPRIFFSNLCLRVYCHSCPYAVVDKPADLTMGDFWGIEDFRPNFDDHKGCSLAITHNLKTELILNQLQNVELLEVSIEEVIKKQSNAFAPSNPHVLRDEFWSDYNKQGISGVLSKYFDYTVKGRFKSFIKYMLFKLRISKYNY